MSFRDDNEEGRDLRKPFLHTGSWYRMGSRQSSMMGSSQVMRDNSISVVACVLIVALGPIQFGFTVSTAQFFLSLNNTNSELELLGSNKWSSLIVENSQFDFLFSFLAVWVFFSDPSSNHQGSWTHSVRGLNLTSCCFFFL